MPRLGVRKLQVKLAENGHDIGRDKLFNLLRESGLLVKRKHYRVITTFSRHWMKKWSNLIRDIVPSHPDEVWVSDITYIEIVQGAKRTFMYLSLITDAYTHEVVGYALHDTLDTTGPLKALGMALAKYHVGTLKGLCIVLEAEQRDYSSFTAMLRRPSTFTSVASLSLSKSYEFLSVEALRYSNLV